jgi:hypothetical protein
MTDDPIFQSDNGEPEGAPASDRFADAIALCNLAANAKVVKARLRELAKVDRQIREAEAKLASVQAHAAELVSKAESDVKAIHEAAAQRLDAAATIEAATRQGSRSSVFCRAGRCAGHADRCAVRHERR